MTNSLIKIIALSGLVIIVAACARPEQISNDNNPGSTKQSEISDFKFQDLIPLIQMNDSFVQEANGIMKSKFKLSYRPNTNISFMQVKVNGQTITEGYSVSGTDLVFNVAPQASSQISVAYDPENLRESIAVSRLVLPADLDTESIHAKFNNQDLYLESLGMSRNANGEIILDPSAIVFDYSDSYSLIHNRGLRLEISALKVN